MEEGRVKQAAEVAAKQSLDRRRTWSLWSPCRRNWQRRILPRSITSSKLRFCWGRGRPCLCLMKVVFLRFDYSWIDVYIVLFIVCTSPLCGHTEKWMSSQVVFLLILDVVRWTVRENYVWDIHHSPTWQHLTLIIWHPTLTTEEFSNYYSMMTFYSPLDLFERRVYSRWDFPHYDSFEWWLYCPNRHGREVIVFTCAF